MFVHTASKIFWPTIHKSTFSGMRHIVTRDDGTNVDERTARRGKIILGGVGNVVYADSCLNYLLEHANDKKPDFKPPMQNDLHRRELEKLYETAIKLSQSNDIKDQFYAVVLLAEARDFPAACCDLGKIYLLGQLVPKNEMKGINYIKEAAEKDCCTALLCLAQCYESGIGVEQNMTKALELYERAATLNYPPALLYLGNIYRMGCLAVEKDLRKALKYYNKAVELKYPEALMKLGDLYRDGIKVDDSILLEQDDNKAIECYEMALKLDINLSPAASITISDTKKSWTLKPEFF